MNANNTRLNSIKNDILTNCQVEDINSYGMGIEFTIQDTSELFEEAE